jgi:O-antigen ligase
VAAFGLAWRFVPGAALDLAWRFVPGSIDALSFEGATLGHAVLLSGLLAAGVVAAIGAFHRAPRWSIAAVVLLTSALSISTKRTGLVALAAGLLVVWLRSPGARRAVGVVAAVAAVTVAGWYLAASVAPAERSVSGVGRFGELATDSSRARVVITQVLAEASMDRPWLGWGPGNTWSAYLTAADIDDVELAQRGILDAHNIVLGALVTTGILGLAAFLALAGAVVVRMRNAPSSRGVAAGVAAALLVHHLLQPVSAPLTPLLFLVAGIAAGPPVAARPLRPAVARMGRAALGLGLVALLTLSLAIFGSSVLHRWGRGYNSIWALRVAVALAPGRIEPVRTLIYYRAQDATVGDPSAAAEVRELVADTFGRHPLFPNVRYVGVDAGLLLNDPDYARMWLRRQLDVFPADRAMLSDRALGFAAGGPAPGYADFAGSQPAPPEGAEG